MPYLGLLIIQVQCIWVLVIAAFKLKKKKNYLVLVVEIPYYFTKYCSVILQQILARLLKSIDNAKYLFAICLKDSFSWIDFVQREF